MIWINSGLIQHLYSKGNANEVCPAQVKAFYIDKTHEHPDRLAWQQGRYFESQCIGKSRDGVEDDLPRDKRNGKKTADHMRIDDQVLVWRQVQKKYHIAVDDSNVQVHLRTPYNEKYGLSGTLDVFPTTVLDISTGEEIPAAIDLKLADDVEGTWGNFCWGSPTHMDFTQGIHYSYLVQTINNELNDFSAYSDAFLEVCKNRGVQFFYFVFGYKKNKGFRNPIRVVMDDMKRSEYKETLRKVVSALDMMAANDWAPERSADLCPRCPITECPMKNAIVDV